MSILANHCNDYDSPQSGRTNRLVASTLCLKDTNCFSDRLRSHIPYNLFTVRVRDDQDAAHLRQALVLSRVCLATKVDTKVIETEVFGVLPFECFDRLETRR